MAKGASGLGKNAFIMAKGNSGIGGGEKSSGGGAINNLLNKTTGMPVLQQLQSMGINGIDEFGDMINNGTKVGDSIQMAQGTFTKTADGQWLSDKGFTFSASEMSRIMLSNNAIGNKNKFVTKQ